MKLMNITNLEGFFEVVNKCQGDVYLTTKEGDRLNLKSQLTKILALSTIFNSPVVKEMEIEVSNPADLAELIHFTMEDNM